ncbi:hypothetical protein HDU96_007704 [Phlyctochytrium bullatum]|nr:hypothetical protein HDU96_007704 [Phlyctochytrium bullatum]
MDVTKDKEDLLKKERNRLAHKIKNQKSKKGFLAFLKKIYYIVTTKGAYVSKNKPPDMENLPPEVKQSESLSNEKRYSLFNLVAKGDIREFRKISESLSGDYRKDFGKDILDQTGPEGETLLHMALLFKSKNHDEIATYLLEKRPNLVNMVYEGGNYYGESCCHILAVHGKLGMLRKFVDAGADVHNPRASGRFFKPSGTLYMGETVLGFAAFMGHADVVRYLVESVGVDPNAIDSQGNNVLHMLAFWGLYNDTRARHPHREEYKSYSRHGELGGLYVYLQEAGADDSLVNASGMTPLQVAVARGHAEMVHAVLNHKREMLWVFGKASSYMYDLTEVDTFVNPISMNHAVGALQIAIQQKRLLEAKWESYGRRMFYYKMFLSVLYYIVFTTIIYFLPNGYEYYSYRVPDVSRLNYFNAGAVGYIRLIMEVMIIFANLFTFFDEIASLRKLGIDYFRGPSAQENIVQWTNMGFILGAALCRFAKASDPENIFLGFHALFGIVSGDLVRFTILTSVFILGFGEALWLQMYPYASYQKWYLSRQNSSVTASASTVTFAPSTTVTEAAVTATDNALETFSSTATAGIITAVTTGVASLVIDSLTFDASSVAATRTMSSQSMQATDDPENVDESEFGQVEDNAGIADWNFLLLSFVWAFRTLLQQGVYDDYRKPRNSWFPIFLFIVMVFTLMILLLNVFLAMLNQTFSKIIEDTEKQWRMIWAQLLLQFDEQILAEYSEDYRSALASPFEDLSLPASPICRIGFPKKMETSLSKRKFLARVRNQRLSWFQRVVLRKNSVMDGKKMDKISKEFEKYCIIFELREDSELPLRIIASADLSSPLSGQWQPSSFSEKPWDRELLAKLEIQAEGGEESRRRKRPVIGSPRKKGESASAKARSVTRTVKSD